MRPRTSGMPRPMHNNPATVQLMPIVMATASMWAPRIQRGDSPRPRRRTRDARPQEKYTITAGPLRLPALFASLITEVSGALFRRHLEALLRRRFQFDADDVQRRRADVLQRVGRQRIAP